MNNVTESVNLKELANDFMLALGSEGDTLEGNKVAKESAHQRVCGFVNTIWTVSANPLLFLSTVMAKYSGVDKAITQARKRSIIRAVRTARSIEIDAIYNRSTKAYHFEVAQEKPVTFEEFCASLLKKIDKSEFDKTAVLLQLQEMLDTPEVEAVEAVDPFDNLI